jgi:SAM-dependent methyltransferase
MTRMTVRLFSASVRSPECPACSTDRVARVLQVREMMFGLDEEFAYAECAGCGTCRLLNLPGDLNHYYPRDYYSVDLDPERELGRRGVRQFATAVGRSRLLGRDLVGRSSVTLLRRRQFQTLMSLLGSVRRAGLPQGPDTRILDVGSGSGMLVYELSLSGLHDVTGIDPFGGDDRTLDSGARLLKRELDEVDGRYDLVMFHHSFEHVLDPMVAAKQAVSLLSPAGRLLVRMPTVSSEAFERYGAQWVQFDAPRHMTVFSRPGMGRLAATAGLQVVDTWDDSTSFQFWGSEQVLAGVPLESPSSHMVDPAVSSFSARQIAEWDRYARKLNAANRGDQAAWVLRPHA